MLLFTKFYQTYRKQWIWWPENISSVLQTILLEQWMKMKVGSTPLAQVKFPGSGFLTRELELPAGSSLGGPQTHSGNKKGNLTSLSHKGLP